MFDSRARILPENRHARSVRTRSISKETQHIDGQYNRTFDGSSSSCETHKRSPLGDLLRHYTVGYHLHRSRLYLTSSSKYESGPGTDVSANGICFRLLYLGLCSL